MQCFVNLEMYANSVSYSLSNLKKCLIIKATSVVGPLSIRVST